MNQVQVPPFELILCQDVDTASRSPLECLLAPQTANKSEQMRKRTLGPPRALGPYLPYLPYPRLLRCGEHLRCNLWGLEAFRGVPGGRGYIVTKFQPKRRHLDLFHARFHDFAQFSYHVSMC